MDAIASALGMSKKTLYQVFPSKRDLLKSILATWQKEVEAGIEDAVFRNKGPFRAKWVSVVEFTASQYGRFGAGFVEDLHKTDPETYQVLDRFRTGLVHKCFRVLAEEGIASGVFRKEIDPAFLSEVYLAIVQATLNPATLDRLNTTPEKAYRDVVSLLLDGISVERT
jgi:AcrR family transcriptional regulator